jgi:hypothetical protein
MEIYMYLYMKLVYICTMELLLAGIYLSGKSLRKPVDYQWNTVLNIHTGKTTRVH